MWTSLILTVCALGSFLVIAGMFLVTSHADWTMMVPRAVRPSQNNPRLQSSLTTLLPATESRIHSGETGFPNGTYLPPWYGEIRQLKNPFIREPGQKCPKDINYKSLADALADNASPDKVVVLPATVDAGYLEMALNFYDFNLHRLGIDNFVFMCINEEACEGLKEYCIPSYLFTQAAHSDKPHTYFDQSFIEKANIKSEIVLEALRLGYHVLLTDVDIAYLKNPFDHLPCPECDVQIQLNQVKAKKPPPYYQYNSGFIYIKNVAQSIEAFQECVDMAKREPKKYHQPIINDVFHALQEKKKLRVIHLDQNDWPAGNTYFLSRHVYFYDDKPPVKQIIVHDNYIVGIVGKTYRFKEHLLWVTDRDGYYSDPHRNYLVYKNPIRFPKENGKHEKAALRGALAIAQLTNRTVILPRFHCKRFCTLAEILGTVDMFHNAYKGLYRESTFLVNPRTPPEVIRGQSPVLAIKNKNYDLKGLYDGIEPAYLLQPSDLMGGATEKEVLDFLAPFSTHRVLRFKALYAAFSMFGDSKKWAEFASKAKSAGI